MQEIRLNLLPVEYRVAKSNLTWVFSRKFVWPMILLITTAVSCMTYWVVLNDELNSLQDTISTQNSRIEKLKPVEKKVKSLVTKIDKIERKNKALVGIQFSKTRWINIFQDLAAILPSNSWLTSIKQVQDNVSLKLNVSTRQFADIAQYMIDLEKRNSFSQVKLIKINTINDNNSQSFKYEIELTLNDEFLSKSFQEAK